MRSEHISYLCYWTCWKWVGGEDLLNVVVRQGEFGQAIINLTFLSSEKVLQKTKKRKFAVFKLNSTFALSWLRIKGKNFERISLFRISQVQLFNP